MIPRLFIYILITLSVLALVPPAIIARARTVRTPSRRIHMVQDMDNQANFRAQAAGPLFADGRAMRQPVAGAVARGELHEDDEYELGVVGEAWTTELPSQVSPSMQLLRRGQERFVIYCSPCHGQSGYGDGIINERAMELMNNPTLGNGTTWVQPKSVHDADIRDQPIGQVYNTVTNGARTMSGYAAQIPTADRWAIAAYVKALQRSQHARPEDLTPAERGSELPVLDLLPEEEPETEAPTEPGVEEAE